MGVMTKLVRGGHGMETHHGGHGMTASNVLQSVPNAITPNSKLDWQVKNAPTVLKAPTTATTAQADKAELQAARYEHAVVEGCRVMKAEGRRQQAHAKLVRGHRDYLGTTAKAHMQVAAANRKLAGNLHELREQYAELGFGLERREQTADQAIHITAHKYGAVK